MSAEAPASSHPPARIAGEIGAGVAVAMVGLPQSIAYAVMSGLAPAHGLAAGAVSGLVAVLVGRAPHLSTGPTNTTALVILGALAPWLAPHGLLPDSALPVLVTLTLMAGALRLVAAAAGGAAIFDFLPESVLVAFSSGVGVLIVASQLDEALGLRAAGAGTVLEQVRALAAQLGAGDRPAPVAAGIAAATVLVVAAGRRWRRFAPWSLLAIAGASLVGVVSGWDAADGLHVLGDRVSLAAGWAPLAWPSLDPRLVVRLLPAAGALALIGTLELAVASRAEDARPDLRREIVAQGCANAVGAFAGAMPASASLSRSALLQQSGASTRLAPASAALVTAALLWVASRFLAFIPDACLAGILLSTGVGMINLRRVRRMWRASPVTRGLLLVTFGSTLVLPLVWAVFLGAGLGLAEHVVETAHPRLLVLRWEGDRLVPLRARDTTDTVVLEVSGNLYYAAVPRLYEAIEAEIPREARLVIDLSHAHGLRYAALLALERVQRERIARGSTVQIAGVAADFLGLLERTGSPLLATAVPFDPRPGRAVAQACGRG
jgi:SulP family sulfate permease